MCGSDLSDFRAQDVCVDLVSGPRVCGGCGFGRSVPGSVAQVVSICKGVWGVVFRVWVEECRV